MDSRIAQLEAENTAYRDKVERLEAALRQWKCGSCGGSGEYFNKRLHYPADMGAPVLLEQMIPCKVCGQSGMHPVARAALSTTQPKDTPDA